MFWHQNQGSGIWGSRDIKRFRTRQIFFAFSESEGHETWRNAKNCFDFWTNCHTFRSKNMKAKARQRHFWNKLNKHITVSKSGWTRATWSLHTITLPNADKRSVTLCNLIASGKAFRKCCNSKSVVDSGTSSPCLLPTHRRPIIRQPAIDPCTTGITSLNSRSKTLQIFTTFLMGPIKSDLCPALSNQTRSN